MDVTVERKDVAALLESLCEHPLADGQAEPSPELEALRRAAAQAFREDSAARGEGSDANEATRLRAALEEAGFSRFRRATETPLNLILEARP